jgi:predicted CXXCH cytochrome family protein
MAFLAASVATASAQAPHFVGTQRCAACHVDETSDWRGTHHALAWTLPGDRSVLGDFNDAVFGHAGVRHRFFRDGERFLVETDGPDGKPATYTVAGVAGIAPLQQYLLETEPGRLQAHDVAWDTERGRWFHLYPDQDVAAGMGLHWTGPYKNWNARCAECHATGFEKRYDAGTERYSSRQAEISVGCEACHGPGSAHVAWADSGGSDTAAAEDLGLLVDLAADDPEVEIQQCAGCHSRREAFSSDSPVAGTPFHDSYRLALLRPGLYHPDGAILDEVYVYGSFLQSKMYANGVRCSNCHDPHTARLKAEGNAVCTACHSPAGNPAFPALRLADYDEPAHHFHEAGGEGANCRACHMIERTYMQVDGRRDHSFRIPRPDLSAETGAPNACTDCHSDRSNDWAAEEIAARFPEGRNGDPHFSQPIAAGRLDPQGNRRALLTIAIEPKAAGIVRATALEMLAAAADPDIAREAAPLLEDDDPVVRAAATAVQRGAADADRIARLVPLLTDQVRAVRIAAVRALITPPPRGLSGEAGTDVARARAEWQAALAAKIDFPETHLVIGGTALVLRNLHAAEAAFREAVSLDPNLVDAWLMLGRIHAAVGDRRSARQVLERALEHNPADLDLLMLQNGLRE